MLIVTYQQYELFFAACCQLMRGMKRVVLLAVRDAGCVDIHTVGLIFCV